MVRMKEKYGRDSKGGRTERESVISNIMRGAATECTSQTRTSTLSLFDPNPSFTVRDTNLVARKSLHCSTTTRHTLHPFLHAYYRKFQSQMASSSTTPLEPITRSRTLLFLSYRDSSVRTPRNRHRPSRSSYSTAEPDVDEHEGLLRSEIGNADHITIEMGSDLLPRW
jgi:hypothetical protein